MLFLLYGYHIEILFDHGIIIFATVVLLLAILIIFAIIITAVVVGMVVVGIATVVIVAIIAAAIVVDIAALDIDVIAMSALHLLSFPLAFHPQIATTPLEYMIVCVITWWMTTKSLLINSVGITKKMR